MPQVDRSALERSWAITIRHLNAARRLLPVVMVPGAEGASLGGFEECLHHNELELALDELEDLGITNSPPSAFWGELAKAAENMQLFERAADITQRSQA
jgi:hypothetical protein